VLDYLASRLERLKGHALVGLSGPQGAGKSTVTAKAMHAIGGGVLVLGLDDFYLPKQGRDQLAKRISPLFQTRGPPGTHDVALLQETIAALTQEQFRPFKTPRFDKLRDDRLSVAEWRQVLTRPKAIILEGWCVGATVSPDFLTSPALNAIEHSDSGLDWRSYQAEQLNGPYQDLWDQIDEFIHLQAPCFETILDWRTQQEASNRGVNESQLPEECRAWVVEFIQHYERITRDMAKGHRRLGLVFQLDESRRIVSVVSAA
jgi:D-glycerate 3-kinase